MIMQRELDETYKIELLQRQAALQAEAEQVVDQLDLINILSHAGKPEHIGSSAAGLMVWRDLDFNILNAHISSKLAFETLLPLATQIIGLQYFNETGPRRVTDLPGDERYYFVLSYQTQAGHVWKIDLSFWLSDGPREQLNHLDYLKQRLTDETRLTILWLKDIWYQLPTYPYQVSGSDIYDAVLEQGVRTPEQFDAYLLARGLPAQDRNNV